MKYKQILINKIQATAHQYIHLTILRYFFPVTHNCMRVVVRNLGNVTLRTD